MRMVIDVNADIEVESFIDLFTAAMEEEGVGSDLLEVHVLSECNSTQFYDRNDDEFDDLEVFKIVEETIKEFLPGIEDTMSLPKDSFIKKLSQNLSKSEKINDLEDFDNVKKAKTDLLRAMERNSLNLGMICCVFDVCGDERKSIYSIAIEDDELRVYYSDNWLGYKQTIGKDVPRKK